MARHLGLVLLALFVSSSAYAQDEGACASLDRASEAYFDARFEEATRLLTPCITDDAANMEARVEAYALLGNVMLSLQQEERARRAVEELLRLHPDYRPDPNERPVFIDLIEEVRGRLAAAQDVIPEQDVVPEVASEIEDVTMETGDDPRVIDLGPVFQTVGDATLSYTAMSSAPDVAATNVEDRGLVIVPVGPGRATVTVAARGPSGAVGRVAFDVRVRSILEPPPAQPAPTPAATPPQRPVPVPVVAERRGGMTRWLLIGGGVVAAGATAAVLLLSGGDDGGGTEPPGPSPLPLPPAFPN